MSLVIGANDVVNPAAKNTPGSPIYGMPVLNVEQSPAVVVLKRSMNTGFAGIDNELFTNDADDDAVRRRQGLARQPGHGRQGRLTRCRVTRLPEV